MYFELKENKPHGTKDDPFSTYHIKNEGRSFQIPVHWHDELEIIYVKSGFLTVSISGENYIGTPGDAFVVSPGNLHFMGSQTGIRILSRCSEQWKIWNSYLRRQRNAESEL